MSILESRRRGSARGRGAYLAASLFPDQDGRTGFWLKFMRKIAKLTLLNMKADVCSERYLLDE